MSKQENQSKSQKRGPGAMMKGGEKPKNFKEIMGKLLNYGKNYKIIVMIAIVFAMTGSILTLIGPHLLSTFTDEISKGIATEMVVTEMEKQGMDVKMLDNPQVFEKIMEKAPQNMESLDIGVEDLKNPGINMDVIFQIGIFLAIMYGIGYLVSVSQGYLLSGVVQKMAKGLRSDLSKKINVLPMGFFSKTSKGDVLSRITNDVDTVGQTLNQSVGTLASAISLLIGSGVMMLITNVTLTITAFVATAIGFAFMMTIVKISQGYFKKQQKYLGKINGHIEEMYTGHTVIKSYNREQKAVDVFEQINDNLRGSAFKAMSLSGLMMPMMGFIGNLGYACVCIVGAILAFDNRISFGIIVAFMLYIRLFTQPLSQIAQAMQNLQSGAAAAERVFEFLEEKEMESEEDKPKLMEPIRGDVEFKNVQFGYNADKIIINDFSTFAKAGQKIAIVGPTGAGKTTIVNLLMRFYEVNSGDILIDGVSTQSIPREVVHGLFCMVLQDTWMFEGTLRENLVYATKNVTQEQIERASKAVGLHHFIRTLPKGYDTILDESTTLSQGQKQQITIARAMIADKPMLILDEATSSIDTRTEIQIQKAMDELMVGRTSFVIAHRLSTIKNADLILVMKDGDIIEQGNHKELLAEKGFYEELYNSQFDEK